MRLCSFQMLINRLALHSICPCHLTMFSALRSLLPLRQDPSSTTGDSRSNSPGSRVTEHDVLQPMSPMSRVTSEMAQLHLESPLRSPITQLQEDISTLHLDDNPMPGSFLRDRDSDKTHGSTNIPNESSSALESLETLITAATLTSSPMDTSSHNKLFSGASEFYQDASTHIPSSVQSLDIHSAMKSLAAVSQPRKPSVLPAFRPGRQFARQSIPRKSNSRSPSPTGSRLGKVERDELNMLQKLTQEFDSHHTDIFSSDFTALSTDLQCRRLDAVTEWLNDGLALIETYEERAKYRKYKTTQTSKTAPKEITLKERRDLLRERMRTLHAKVCALYAPIMPQSPIQVDADNLFNSDLPHLAPINQVLILLAVIFHMIIGLSLVESNFLLQVAVSCVQLGMYTCGSRIGSQAPEFSPSQQDIISGMPRNIPDALKRLDVDGHFDLYAVCPTCSYTNKAHPLTGKKTFYHYPDTCDNHVVGEDGSSRCGTDLLKTRRDGTVQPIKPYLVSSLPDYLARCLADSTFVEQSKDATDSALRNIHSGKSSSEVHNVFEADFVKDFRGPDGKLFVDRGDKIRLAFSMGHILR
ncbi:hypothetical protein FB446DRAFT_12318 [Lentinula raphanica]|nr:hypothetical protein FB446DRAFT_12318 [Lentinula raphanica]